jgi:hypothetical protein
MFHLKRNPNCYTWNLHTRNEETSINAEYLKPYPAVADDALPEIGMAIISAASCVPKYFYQSVYCCLIRYFLVRIRIAKWFTNSNKLFRCEAMSKLKHTFCSHLNSFCANGVSSGHATGVTLTRVSRGKLEESVIRGGPASDFVLYWSTWLLLGCVLNGSLHRVLPAECNNFIAWGEGSSNNSTVVWGIVFLRRTKQNKSAYFQGNACLTCIITFRSHLIYAA